MSGTTAATLAGAKGVKGSSPEDPTNMGKFVGCGGLSQLGGLCRLFLDRVETNFARRWGTTLRGSCSCVSSPPLQI